MSEKELRRVNIKETFDREWACWHYLRDRFCAIDQMQTVFVLSNTQNNLATEVFTESELDQYHFTAPLLKDLSHILPHSTRQYSAVDSDPKRTKQRIQSQQNNSFSATRSQ